MRERMVEEDATITSLVCTCAPPADSPACYIPQEAGSFASQPLQLIRTPGNSGRV